MLVKTSKYSNAILNTNEHYKMYKAGKSILFAGLLSTSLILSATTFNNSVTAHADTNGINTQATASNSKQQQATASNSKQQQATASNSTTITPSNQTEKDKAMGSAAQSGVKVTSGGTKVINANQDNYKDAEKQAEQNYQDQINKAKETQKQQETNTNNYNQALDKYNKDKTAAEAYNKQQQDKYNSDLDAYNKAKAENKVKNDEITNNNAEIDKANQKLTDKYNQKKAVVDAQNNAADADHANKMAEWNKKVSEIKAHNALVESENQAALNTYNQQLANYENSFKNNNTGWTEQQLKNFYGSDIRNITYVNVGNVPGQSMSFQMINGEKVPSNIYNNHPLLTTNDDWSRNVGLYNYYYIKPGLQWRYNNAFMDNTTNTPVDLIITVTGCDNNDSGDILGIGTKHIGTIYGNYKNESKAANVYYNVKFVNHYTNTPINIEPLIGVGDIDFWQKTSVTGAKRVLAGSGLKTTQNGNSISADGTEVTANGIENDDIRGQAWFLLPNTSSFNYSFYGGIAAWQELGNLTLPGGNFPNPPYLKSKDPLPDPPHSLAHKIPYPDKPQLTPHQEHIPFDGKEPTPPTLKPMPVEPTKPADLSLDTNDIVINYTPSPTKQWEENSVSTNNKIYMNGETPTANISVNIPDEAHIDSFALNEDYSKFSQDVSVLSIHVLHDGKLENDNDYTVNDDKNRHLIVTRNNMNSFTGGQYQLIIEFKINSDVKPNTVLENNGGITLNGNETNVPPVKITTWNPNPTKDVNLGDNETANISESANNWHIADGQILTYPLQNVILPANRETTFTSWKQTDDLDSHLTYKGFKAFLNGQDVTSHIKMTVNGQNLEMDYDNWLIQQMNANKAEAFKMPLVMIAATAHGQDGAEIDNKYQITAIVKNVGNPKTNPNGNTQEHTVTLTSNTVRNYLIKDIAPVKKDLNAQGVDIDNMNVTPGSVQDYQLIKDFSSYKDAHVSADHQTFYWVDDWPEQALKNPDLTLTKVTNQNKQTVNGLTGKVYNSLSEVPEAARQQLEKAGIKPTGTFILWTGNQDFIKNQILTGNKVTISIPGTVKDTFTGKYENKSWTITFGHGAPSNVVVNNVEKINPTKDIVLDANSTKSLNNATIKLGQVFDYKLNGQILPAKTGTPLTQYGWQDKFDTTHDQLTGQVKAVALVDIYLKDGTTLKKGTDLTKYITKVTNKDGSITWQFKKDFLSQVDLIKGSFGADLFVQAKRIKSGNVKNQYTFWLNGKPYKSNVVISHTPEPAKPQPKTPAPTPQLGVDAAPITPASATPQQLAQTNVANKSNNAGLIGLALVGSTLSIAMLGKKKKYTID